MVPKRAPSSKLLQSRNRSLLRRIPENRVFLKALYPKSIPQNLCKMYSHSAEVETNSRILKSLELENYLLIMYPNSHDVKTLLSGKDHYKRIVLQVGKRVVLKNKICIKLKNNKAIREVCRSPHDKAIFQV